MWNPRLSQLTPENFVRERMHSLWCLLSPVWDFTHVPYCMASQRDHYDPVEGARQRAPQSVAGVRRAGVRAQEGKDSAPKNGEDVSAAKILSNDALRNKATAFFVFSVLVLIFQPVFFFGDTTATGRTDAGFLGRQSE